MKKEEYSEWMLLSLYGELGSDEQELLEAYLKKHPEARKEFRELQKFHTMVKDHTAPATEGSLLDEARAGLREALRGERKKVPFMVRLRRFSSEFLRPSFALSGAGMLLCGLLIGYGIFAPHAAEQGFVLQPALDRSAEESPTEVTNVRFIDSDASDGEVEFEFDAVAPVHVKGRVDDPQIQRLLTHALLNESNAGVRISSMNAISGQADKSAVPDTSIRSALILAVTKDPNPGVRREALRVLQRFPFDASVRDALLHVIAKDANSGLRVAAINALEMMKMDGTKFDETTVNALKEQIKKEQNNYIRNRAVNLVKEVYQ